MTDPRLAMGLTREGFRNDFKPSPQRGHLMERLVSKYVDTLQKRKFVPKDQVLDFIETEAAYKRVPHELLFMLRHHNPGRARLSQHTEESLTAGYFVPAKGPYEGREEQFRRYMLIHDRVGRTYLDSRYLPTQTWLREHAMKRFIERDGGGFRDVTAALWPGILILDALQAFYRTAGIEYPFIIPSSSGLFIGTTQLTHEQGMLYQVFRHTYRLDIGWVPTFKLPYGESFPCFWIHTFVSRNETSIYQNEVCYEARRLIARHQEGLTALHIMDVHAFETYADGAIVSELMTTDFDWMRRDFAELFGSALWRQHVRLPRAIKANP